jgi:4-amino-4-deoxy-L-arabinose transferase-like glycosyltransferase
VRLGLAALAALTLLRLVVAAATPLSPDEAYYWVWSRALAPGYLDHPPMIALWIRLGTLLAGDTNLGIRLLAPVSAALGSLLLARAGELLLAGRRVGLAAAALLNATLLFGVGAVTMTPDTPLLFFWTATLWALAALLRSGDGKWFLAAGVFGGLALASKYTAVFLGGGIFLWLLAVPALRPWLRRPEPWIGAVLAGAVFMPVLLWNAAHGWASLAKQGGRVGAWNPGRAAQFLGELIGGQIGLATPLVFVICGAGTAAAARIAWRTREPAWTLLASLTLPLVLVFLQHALGDRVQGAWPAPVYPAAAVAGAGLSGRFWIRLRPAAVALGAVVTLVVYIQATLAPVALSPHIDPTALRLAGWPGLARGVSEAARQEQASFVAADDYGIAAELARAIDPGLTVIGVEPRWALFDLPRAELAGRTGLLVRSLRRGNDLDRSPWSSVEEVGSTRRTRAQVVAEEFRLYRVVGRQERPDGGAQGGSVTVVLPRPE